MYTQFFGNFLLNKGVISPKELLDAMEKQSQIHIKLGTLAMHEGLLTASEVNNIIIMQTHQDKKFGEIAIEEGYLTEEQVHDLLEKQQPDYLLLGQILIEDGLISNADFENLISDYQSLNEIYDLEANNAQIAPISNLLNDFCEFESEEVRNNAIDYLTLLFNNLIRFIGSDYTPLTPILCREGYPTNFCAAQQISGKIKIQAAIDVDASTAIAFASRYAHEECTEFDEYTKATLEDFLNLHNGLFNVNMSNKCSIELSLSPPEVHSGDILEFKGNMYLLPIIFPFGMLHFILSFA